MATNAAVRTFRRVYANPAAPAQEEADRLAAYALLWSYYTNSAFDDLALWQSYRARNRLYRQTRPIYNPARRLVDFYAGTVYQGRWTSRPQEMTQPNAAIPWATETPPALLDAIGQLYTWSNWASQKALMLRYGAALGDVLVIVADDPARGKVYLDTIWPGNVAAVTLNPAGDVTAYTLEYAITDAATGQTYTYRREVDKDAIRTYRDDQPHAYDGQPAEAENPYGFVPATWTMHTPTGGSHGEPALRNIAKIDELNALAAHALDQAHRILEAPILITGDNINAGGITPSRNGPTTSSASAGRSPDPGDIKAITAAAGGDIKTTRLDPGEALEHIDHLLKEIEADHPEIGMYQQLRSMTQVSGPAADRLFGDVAALVTEARAQYDRSIVKLFQMAVAIAGWRVQAGAWPAPTAQQAKFAGYNLDSYAAGDLDLDIQSRPLIMPTESELIAIERQRIGLDADRQYTAAGQPPTTGNTPAGIADRLRRAAQEQRELQG